MVIIALFTFAVIVLLIIAGNFAAISSGGTKERQQQQEAAAERLRRMQETTEQLQAHLNQARLPLYQGALPLILKPKECPLLCANAVLAEERAVRTYDGTTVRLGKGCSSTSGTSQSHGVLKPIDSGHLVLTNKRLIFVGSLRTTATDLGKLLSAEVFDDSMRVNRHGKAKAETYITQDPVAYSIIINVLARIPVREITGDAVMLGDNVNINLNKIV